MKVGKHFNIWEWVDFVRNTGDSSRSSTMNEHLAAGCRRCERVVRVLGDFARRSRYDTGNEPAAHVIRCAEAIFPARRAGSTVLGRLIYDSFREPLPAGMRAQGRLARHALYEAGDVFVDLQMEQTPAGVVSLLGQISDRDRPQDAPAPPTPVLLTSGRALVASTVCNLLGEFELTYKPARDLRLHVPLANARGHVQLRMDELARASSMRRRRLR